MTDTEKRADAAPVAAPDAARGWRSGARTGARFGVVGLVAFVIDLGAFNLLRYGVDLGPLTSKTLSVLVATTAAFLGNRHWAFSDRRRRRVGAAYVLFFAANAGGLLIALACLAVSIHLLGLDSPLAENVSANVVGLGLGTLFRFWAYHRWVFPHSDDPAAT